MGLDFGLPFRRGTKTWKKDDVYDAVFVLRLMVAAVTGITFGVFGIKGFPAFLVFVLINFVGATSWLNHQGINVEEYDSEQSPLHMEGFPAAISFFLVSILLFILLLFSQQLK